MGKVARSKKVHALPSKTHSCSELESGHEKLLAIKREHPDPAELQKEIEEQCAYILYVDFSSSKTSCSDILGKLCVRSMKLSWQPSRSKKKTRPQIPLVEQCVSNQNCVSQSVRYKYYILIPSSICPGRSIHSWRWDATSHLAAAPENGVWDCYSISVYPCSLQCKIIRTSHAKSLF